MFSLYHMDLEKYIELNWIRELDGLVGTPG